MKLVPATDIKVGDVLIYRHCRNQNDDWNNKKVVITAVPKTKWDLHIGYLKDDINRVGRIYRDELFTEVKSNQKRDKNGRFLGKARNKPIFTPLYKRGDIVEQTSSEHLGRLFLILNHKANNIYDTICVKRSGWSDYMRLGSKNSSILGKEWSRLFIDGSLLTLNK